MAATPLVRSGGSLAAGFDAGPGIGQAGPRLCCCELDFADHRLDHLGRKLKTKLQIGQIEERAAAPLPQQAAATVGGKSQLLLQQLATGLVELHRQRALHHRRCVIPTENQQGAPQLQGEGVQVQ